MNVEDNPRRREMLELGEAIGRAINRSPTNRRKTLEPPQMGYVLMIFPFSDVSMINYVTNASRDQALAVLKHEVARLERQL